MLPKHLVSFLLLLSCLITSASFALNQLLSEPEAGSAPFLNAIDHAKKSIDLVIYGLTDQSIVKALTQAHQRGVNVRVILQEAPYKAAGENRLSLKKLKQAGVAVQSGNPAFRLTHQKTLIIDQDQATIMTLNFTYSAFHQQRNFAYSTDQKKIIRPILAVFNADWQHKSIQAIGTRLIWSPDNSQKKLSSLISQAHHYIDLYAQSLTEHHLMQQLAKTAHRGVTIRVILPRQWQDQACESMHWMADHDIHIHLAEKPYIHAKAMLIDFPSPYEEGFIGSMNYTHAGLASNRELGILFQDRTALETLKTDFLNDWQHSQRFVGACSAKQVA